MKTFEQSLKSQKTVKCMIETRGEKPKEKVKNKKNKGSKKEAPKRWSEHVSGLSPSGIEAVTAPGKASAGDKQPSAAGEKEELTKDEILQKNREEFFKRHMKAGEKSRSPKPEAQKEKGKKPRVWDLGNSNAKVLDYSNSATNGSAEACPVEEFDPDIKLEGKVMGTFTTVTSTVKQALQEALVQILQPQRRVDVLRDVMDAQRHRRPYVVTFCGVNGVGKSTNLAKISFWLIENGFSVLIAACDTFRAGAVEQLRTHTRRLNALHPPESHGGRTMVQLYEKGYGKDAAGIAMEAISYARNQGFDVVLVDTAGRMQDNAPLMTALAKLIAVNAPDLVLFVGEALVGNEAVDQLVSVKSLFPQRLGSSSTRRWLITPWPRRRASSTGLSSPSSIPSTTR
ncbi:signal recognition particle receptor subunit hypothetical protein [Limosa lapponica baueri]|uniref:Signal recognition particle receptor subunit alpha n=1 Tax=Limosa lapponica baueri TaxID=1758121 RepID=A0A2I0T9D4_LIMLA|nr:signal recognition particle receptor subunit hypothetical protein [Limosa lapponica baueri]